MIAPLATTGIGSLPHTDLGRALDQAFRVDLPYLPQLPRRDPREFMLAQALEGMPGIVAEDSGAVLFDADAWKKGRASWDDALYEALRNDQPKDFAPTGAYVACWEPFLARVRAERRATAKVQLAGPMTVQWTLRTPDGAMPPPAAIEHVVRTVLARSLAMTDALKATGAEPVVFIDEPGLYAFSRTQPNHIVMMQELRIQVMALKKRGAKVGIHCCSDADWGAIIGLGADFVAVDARLSLPSLLRAGEALVTWVAMGGRPALGVIPTQASEVRIGAMELLEEMHRRLEQYFPTRASVFHNLLHRSLLTPACGMAFSTEPEAEEIVSELERFRALYARER